MKLTARKLDQIATRIESAAMNVLRSTIKQGDAEKDELTFAAKDTVAMALVAQDVRSGNIVQASRRADKLDTAVRDTLAEADPQIAELFAWDLF